MSDPIKPYSWDDLRADARAGNKTPQNMMLCSRDIHDKLVEMEKEEADAWLKRAAWPRWRYRMWMWWRWLIEWRER